MEELRAIARPATLAQMVFDMIEEAIMREELPPGSAISETQLARRFGVSKTPVREALLRFRELGLIEPNGPQSLQVVEPSSRRISDAYVVRSVLESTAVRLATERAVESDKKLIEARAIASVEAAKSIPETFGDRDRDFHLALISASGNEYLQTVARAALTRVRVLRTRDVPLAGDAVQCAEEHIEIAQSMAAGHADRAAELTRAHIEKVRRNVLDAYLTIHLGGRVEQISEFQATE